MNNFKIYYPHCDYNQATCSSFCQDELNQIEKMTNFQTQPRSEGCFNILINSAARKYNNNSDPTQSRNDDYLNPKKIGLFSKSLPHNSIGEVDLDAYASYENAMQNGAGHPELFDQIKTSGSLNGGVGYRKLTNPQAGLAFDLEGYDSHFMSAPSAPSVYSQQSMDELIETYWMSITRDINFSDYNTNPLTIEAAKDLTSKSAFYGPRINNEVTPNTLFRGNFEGDLVGPYISQFLYLDCPFGAATINQKIKTYSPNVNFIKDYQTFLDIQNGKVPTEKQVFDNVLRYIRNGRDLCAWVRMDVSYGAFFNAMLILMNRPSVGTQNAGISCPVSSSNPYKSPNPSSINQDGFVTFGQPHLCSLLAEVAQRALKVTWYQKFFVQNRLRPEEMAGFVYNEVNNLAQYSLNKDYLNSTYFSQPNSNYLLEQAYNEGSPIHPSYLAGHAAIAGACVTILKCWFNTDFVIPNPVKPSPDGLTLEPYVIGVDGPPLTVLGELNKLASNIGIGRNIAGVHFHSDYLQSTFYGEELAISILQDQAYLYNEKFQGWVLTKFNGDKVLINKEITNL